MTILDEIGRICLDARLIDPDVMLGLSGIRVRGACGQADRRHTSGVDRRGRRGGPCVHRRRVPVVARGAGTGCRSANAVDGSIVIALDE